MQPFNEKDGGDGGSFPLGALLRADSHRLMAGESSPYASAQASGGHPSSMTGFEEINDTENREWFTKIKADAAAKAALKAVRARV